jgi:hypothetical protein
MPYTIRKQSCKQADGDSGTYVLSYTTKKGKKVKNCHTSKKNAQGQIAAIEGPKNEADGMEDMAPAMPAVAIKDPSPESRSKDVGSLDDLLEAVIIRLMEMQNGNNGR